MENTITFYNTLLETLDKDTIIQMCQFNAQNRSGSINDFHKTMDIYWERRKEIETAWNNMSK
jgi:hypothetical protein